MAREDMVNHLAERTGLSKAAVREVVNLYHEEIRFLLSTGKQVRLHGLGTLRVKTLAARDMKVLIRGVEHAMRVGERKTVGFKAHTALKQAVR